MKKFTLIGFVVFCLFLFYAAYDLGYVVKRDFGAPPSSMDDRIIGSYNSTTGEWEYGAVNETGANNAVTSVVFDYRGYDTLGEATVLFTAIAGVMLLFGGRKHE